MEMNSVQRGRPEGKDCVCGVRGGGRGREEGRDYFPACPCVSSPGCSPRCMRSGSRSTESLQSFSVNHTQGVHWRCQYLRKINRKVNSLNFKVNVKSEVRVHVHGY